MGTFEISILLFTQKKRSQHCYWGDILCTQGPKLEINYGEAMRN